MKTSSRKNRRYVIVRDDDTNALTPPERLEHLYRPFLERGLPVNLAVIPNVHTDVTRPDGRPEGFLPTDGVNDHRAVPIGSSPKLVNYLLDNPGYHIVQHGYHHEPAEFDREDREDIARRIDKGTSLLLEAGFPKPKAFVAPHDKFSRVSLDEVSQRFPVISTGWFELGRLPLDWWPNYLFKKLLGQPHWRVQNTTLLSHPGCILSCHRNPDSMLEAVKQSVERRQLTVLVTHWWEYFQDGRVNEPFTRVLHQVAAWLKDDPRIEVLSFSEGAARL